MFDVLGPNPLAVLFIIGVFIFVIISLLQILYPERLRTLVKGGLVFFGVANLAFLLVEPISPYFQAFGALFPFAVVIPGAAGSIALLFLAVAALVGGILLEIPVVSVASALTFFLLIAFGKYAWEIEI